VTIEVRDHSIEGWREFATAAGFVPDPMILRAGEVFINGLSGVRALNKPDLEVWAAIQENIAGLSDFFDLVVTRDRIPLIDYHYTFDHDGLARPLEQLLGLKALPVTIDYGPYDLVKQGAFNSLRQIASKKFGHLAISSRNWTASAMTGSRSCATTGAKHRGCQMSTRWTLAHNARLDSFSVVSSSAVSRRQAVRTTISSQSAHVSSCR